MCLTYLTDFVVWIEALKTEIQICWQYCREWNNKNANLIIKCWKYMILLSYLQWKLVNKIWYSCGKNEPKIWQNWKKKNQINSENLASTSFFGYMLHVWISLYVEFYLPFTNDFVNIKFLMSRKFYLIKNISKLWFGTIEGLNSTNEGLMVVFR